MFDPPREDTAQTIAEAQFLGLQVKMLTGDAIAIAKETCKMLALGTRVYNSDRLIHGGLSGTTQHDLVERADGFAEVFPEVNILRPSPICPRTSLDTQQHRADTMSVHSINTKSSR